MISNSEPPNVPADRTLTREDWGRLVEAFRQQTELALKLASETSELRAELREISLLKMASAFDVVPPDQARPPLRLHLVQVERRSYPPHEESWAITSGSRSCLTKDGDWEVEPPPSSRDEAWLKRARWPNASEAIKFARDHLKKYPTGFQEE